MLKTAAQFDLDQHALQGALVSFAENVIQKTLELRVRSHCSDSNRLRTARLSFSRTRVNRDSMAFSLRSQRLAISRTDSPSKYFHSRSCFSSSASPSTQS